MKNHRPIIALIIPAFILVSAFAAQSQEPVKSDEYICRDLKGNKRWQASHTIRPLKTKDLYVLTEEGRGTYSGFKEPVRWKADTEFLDDGVKIVPLRMKKTFFSENGNVVFEGAQEFDPEKNEVTCVKKWPDTGRQVRKTFRYKGDVVNEYLLGPYTERYLKNGEREKSFYLVSNDPAIYDIRAAVQSEEEIAINGRKMTAYKIFLDPKVGLFGFLAPKTYVWHLAGGECNWLKYRGAEDTLNSPEVEMEKGGSA